jgi:hypothetical protein
VWERQWKEIQDYLECCNSLLSPTLLRSALSEDEEGIVEYYAVELSNLRPRQRSKLFMQGINAITVHCSKTLFLTMSNFDQIATTCSSNVGSPYGADHMEVKS